MNEIAKQAELIGDLAIEIGLDARPSVGQRGERPADSWPDAGKAVTVMRGVSREANRACGAG